MKTHLIKENAKLWQTTVVEVANDDDEIMKMANHLLLSLQLKRGKPVGLGIGAALEILANLGVYMNETETKHEQIITHITG